MTNCVFEEWDRLRVELEAARERWGWDDPRTIEIEEAESDACQLWVTIGRGGE